MDLSVQRQKLSDADAGGEDCLSALPDDLLIHILVLLDDAAEAARTSVLASRWRRLWLLLPELNLNSIEHHRIGAVLAAHEAPDLTRLIARTKDASPESLSAWLPLAARVLSGHMRLELEEVQRGAEERGAAVDLPCFHKATSIVLNLGLLDLALPPNGVFARLQELQLIGIRLHGQSGFGDLLSSQRCPYLWFLRVSDARGLDSLNIQSDSLMCMELLDLHRLPQLTVVAPELRKLQLSTSMDPRNTELAVANISAPLLMSLEWMDVYYPSSIQFDAMAHLESLGIHFYILDEEEEEAFEHNHYWLTFLQRYEHIRSLDLMISYPSVICTGPYLTENMPSLPNITFLMLSLIVWGHSFGASLFDVLRRCTGVKKLHLDFFPENQSEEPCPSGCICDQPANWRTEELALNCLEEIKIHMRGTEHEVALVQRIFHWATVLRRAKISFHEPITESNERELRQLLLSFPRVDISMDFSVFGQ
ncbi:F-box protein At5g03100 [Lolium perenne]|uniref:F-box protein At5g03100 n=1 Tax=Lolium perenne TaxID=4522 RepID=UPI0021F5536D|nr:putative F-box/FBD/LRR-repeat protein At5g56810 [Lolium perenne]